MGKKSKKGKAPATGLMAGLIKAGVVSEKQARQIKREQRDERKQIKKEQGYAGLEAAERAKLAELEALKEQRKVETRERAAERAVRDRRERIQQLLRDRIHARGNRSFYFVRPDKRIDFVEVDDSTIGLLGRREAAIARDEAGLPGDYLILPCNSKLDELRGLDPELILFPR